MNQGQPGDVSQESMRETLFKDATKVASKFKYVFSPEARNEGGGSLKHWDLWGPLSLSLVLSLLLWFESASGERQHAFGLVFVLIWGGSALVSISTTLLGGKGISLLQSIGVLGYSLAPIVAAAVVCAIFPFRLAFFRLLFLGAGFYFAFPPAASYLRSAVPEDKVFLALYPLALLYASISALVLLV